MSELATASSRSFELSSPDGPVEIDITWESDDITRIEVAESWPESLSKVGVARLLEDSADSTVETKDEVGMWARTISPYSDGFFTHIEEGDRYKGIVQALGYSFTWQTKVVDRQAISTVTYTYPSITRANRFMERVFSEPPLELIAFDGGEYSAEEFMKTFLGEGKVLIASEPPYAAHDLSNHVLGWLGLPPELIGTLRQRFGTYLNRLELERTRGLHWLPMDGDCGEDDKEQAQDFFYGPTKTVLGKAMDNLDQLSGRIGYYAIEMDLSSEESLPRYIGEEIGKVFESGQSLGKKIPSGLFGAAPDCNSTAAKVIERYRKADEIGQEIVAAGGNF